MFRIDRVIVFLAAACAISPAWAQVARGDSGEPNLTFQKSDQRRFGETDRRRLERRGWPGAWDRSDPPSLARFGNRERKGGWGGRKCLDADELRSSIDEYLATPLPEFPERGSTVPGLSASWQGDRCGAFTYAAGLRNIEKNRPMTPETPMTIASMTKPILAAITLQLAEGGLFGPRGLDTTIDKLLPAAKIRALTVGNDPGNPRCPGETWLFNRDAGFFEWTAFSCPDLSRVNLRDLMRANHGMVDLLSEDATPEGTRPYWDGVFYEAYAAAGFEPVRPRNPRNGYEYLKWVGLKRYDAATIGGDRFGDFESSFGNTGFQLLGVILEERTRLPLDTLVRRLIVEPLRLRPIELYLDPAQRAKQIANSYVAVTDLPLYTDAGVYPLVNFNGHHLINSLELGLGRPGNVNMAGGAGGLIADPTSYGIFLDKFVNGGLLGRKAQQELENSYVSIPEFDEPGYALSTGFGLFKIAQSNLLTLPDIDIYSHGGLLPGANCANGVFKLAGSRKALLTGVMCQNAGVGWAPDMDSLFFPQARAILEAMDLQNAK